MAIIQHRDLQQTSNTTVVGSILNMLLAMLDGNHYQNQKNGCPIQQKDSKHKPCTISSQSIIDLNISKMTDMTTSLNTENRNKDQTPLSLGQFLTYKQAF